MGLFYSIIETIKSYRGFLYFILINPLRIAENLTLVLERSICIVSFVFIARTTYILFKHRLSNAPSHPNINHNSLRIFSISDGLFMYFYILSTTFKKFLDILGAALSLMLDEKMNFSIFPADEISLIMYLIQAFIIMFLFIRVYRSNYQACFRNYYTDGETMGRNMLVYLVVLCWIVPDNELFELFYIFITHHTIFNMKMAFIIFKMATKAASIVAISMIFYYYVFSYVVGLENKLVTITTRRAPDQSAAVNNDMAELDISFSPRVPPIGLLDDPNLLPTYQDLYGLNYPSLPAPTAPCYYPPPPYSLRSNES